MLSAESRARAKLQVGEARMVAQIRVDDADFRTFIRSDSVVTIRRTLGIGDAFVEIVKGTGSELPPQGGVLVAAADQAPTQLVEKTVRQLADETIPVLQQARAMMTEYTKLAADLRDPHGKLQLAIAHLEGVSGRIERGDGMYGRVFIDPKVASEFADAVSHLRSSLDHADAFFRDLHNASGSVPAITANANDATKQLPMLITQASEVLNRSQAALKNVEQATAKLPDTVAAINQTVESLPGVLLQSQETLRQIQRLVEGLQKNWLVRSYMDQPAAAGPRIRPGQVEGGSR